MRFSLICAVVFLFLGSLNAQVQVGVNINIGNQPVWGPIGYDYVEYYYMPDLDVFYYVPTHRFVYLEGRRWVFAPRLPARFGKIDLYTIHKEVINENRPYLRHDFYRDRFIRYKGMHDQQIIRDSHDSKYFIIKGHPEHNNRMKKQGHGRIKRIEGKGRGIDKGNNERGHDRNKKGKGGH